MTDLERIKEIENTIGFELERVDPEKFGTPSKIFKRRYCIDHNDYLSMLSIEGIPSNRTPTNLLNDFDRLQVLCLPFCHLTSSVIPNVLGQLLNKDQLVALDLSDNNLNDISFFKECKQLHSLNLSYNKISTIHNLKLFKKLITLNLNSNKISDISALGELVDLCSLQLNDNQINDISSLKSLKKLTEISLCRNSIYKIESIGELLNLLTIDLSNNRIKNISSLKNLKELSILSLDSNKVNDLSAISELRKLTKLSFSFNSISDISHIREIDELTDIDLSSNAINEIPDLNHLTKLKKLNLSNNNIDDIRNLKVLNTLSELYLERNKITGIFPLQDLKKLTTINLADNNIKVIPEWLASMGMDIKITEAMIPNCINLHDNPIHTPPIEIVKQGSNAISLWYASNRRKLNEIKVLLVGEAKAGKTSLMRRLLNNSYNPQESQTDGILIESFKFGELHTFQKQKRLHEITAYFWDFGGQEIMSSTHQFFMTKRSLYILVLEARKDEKSDEQVRTWMRRVKAFGGDSQVIIVVNKIDQNRSFSLDESTLRREYPQIKEILRVSCASAENCDAVKDALAEYIPKTELFNTEIDERWFPVKCELQNRTSKDYYLPEQEFETICNLHGLTEVSEQLSAVRFLNDLGMVLHFEGLKLTEFYVLDPYWVTSGVYRIITSDIAAQQKGIVDVEQLRSIINCSASKPQKYVSVTEHRITYTPNEVRYIADIMEKFKLCYYMEQGQKILIPDLLDKNTPTEECNPFYTTTSRIAIIYNYYYLPNAILPRFIVEMRNDIHKVWRTGVILQCTGCFDAHALVYTSENRIHIIVTGEHKQKREYLSAIRYCINNINKDYTLTTSVQIPLPGTENLAVEYEELLAMEQAGQRKYKLYKIKKEWEISILLDGIASEEEVQKMATPSANTNYGASDSFQAQPKQKPSAPKTVTIFLASSKELKDHREQFELFIGRQNKHYFGNHEFFLQVELWEDFIDAMDKNRLQDAYNRTIKGCDIFVMLYWTKVGMYTAEEFEVAFGQFIETNRPMVYTYEYGADIPKSKLNEQETTSLFSFNNKLKALGHFPTQYANIDDLKNQFSSQLQKILGKITNTLN